MAKVKAIAVEMDGYLYLQNRSHLERCGQDFSQITIDRLKNNFNTHSLNGFYTLMDKCLGGCNGSPVNAYEERRWTIWSTQQMVKMLEEQGMTWKSVEDVECIEI